jgi:DNA invertase Pin-like site-specific DNA recombinase
MWENGVVKQLRAVTYARVSTTKTSQDTSVRRQVAELKEVAARRGWTVEYQFSDRISGGVERPGLDAALDHLFRGRADILVVHDLDRLGRNVRSMLANVDAIHAAGAHFYVLDRHWDTSSAEGRLIFTIFAALAEFQRKLLGEKIKAGLAFARKKGKRLGGAPAMTPAALARAVELRAGHPRPSWAEIVVKIRAAKLGTYARGTLAGAVTRALKAARSPRALRAAAINREIRQHPNMSDAQHLKRQTAEHAEWKRGV